ncbi:MAG: gliding motility-associated ABC transporter ATP-binding subunit GldA [Bacteroidetes bacterium]|nr:gliding motility-associated ABC transporter ATP-binding subunit GldA [Bacteroidota bacterium]MBL6943490.1 gliding motility-associated ABC transporter ATP-binding subunit GldA [Bacteroidales bacterium]
MFTVKIEEVTKYYGQQKALDNINLSINKGEVVGLLGPNGAGKSTLLKIITSFLPPSEGTVKINGLDVRDNSLEIRKLIGYLPEHNPLYHDMYVKEYLEFVLRTYPGHKNIKIKIDNIIQLTGLEIEKKKKIGALSKGYKQRVGLAQALIHNPEILILDEPTSGLDPNQLVEIRKIITELGKEKTIILSTHIMQEVEAICNRVVIIDHGSIVADDSPKNLSKKADKSTSYKVEFKEEVNHKLIEKIVGVSKAVHLGNNEWIITSTGNKDIRENIFKFAVTNNFNVLSLAVEKQKMEDIFHRLTK